MSTPMTLFHGNRTNQAAVGLHGGRVLFQQILSFFLLERKKILSRRQGTTTDNVINTPLNNKQGLCIAIWLKDNLVSIFTADKALIKH